MSDEHLPPVDLDAIYREHADGMVALAVSKFGLPVEVAREIAQEIFLRLVAKDRRVGEYGGWLAVVMLNACRKHLAVTTRRQSLMPAAGPFSVDPRPALEQRLLVAAAMRVLDERSALVLQLHFLEGYTAPEIAALLGTTKDYVHKLVHQALQTARAALPKEQQ